MNNRCSKVVILPPQIVRGEIMLTNDEIKFKLKHIAIRLSKEQKSGKNGGMFYEGDAGEEFLLDTAVRGVISNNISDDRFREICFAEYANQLVVLKCKNGDTVSCLVNDEGEINTNATRVCETKVIDVSIVWEYEKCYPIYMADIKSTDSSKSNVYFTNDDINVSVFIMR